MSTPRLHPADLLWAGAEVEEGAEVAWHLTSYHGETSYARPSQPVGWLGGGGDLKPTLKRRGVEYNSDI